MSYHLYSGLSVSKKLKSTSNIFVEHNLCQAVKIMDSGIISNGLLIDHEEGTRSCVVVNSLRGLRVASTKDSFVGGPLPYGMKVEIQITV